VGTRPRCSRKEARVNGAQHRLRDRKLILGPMTITQAVSSPVRPLGTHKTMAKISMLFINTIKISRSTAESQDNRYLAAKRVKGTSKPCSKCNGRRTSKRIRHMRSNFRVYQVNPNNLQASVSEGMALIKNRPSRTGGGAHQKALSSMKTGSPRVGARELL
jgi:hypothetical protein